MDTRRVWTVSGQDLGQRPDSDRLLVLDGLRGFAAIAVVLYHFGSVLGVRHLLAHAYLAVDFFFGLSGFVLARAYDPDVSVHRIGARRFVLKRLIRLWPQILLGAAVGLAMTAASSLVVGGGFHFTLPLAISFLATCLLVPGIPWLNGAFWSLFAELAVNALYLPLRFLGAVGLSVAAALSLLVMIVSVTQLGSIEIGPGDWRHLPLGMVRAAPPFLEGVLISRYGQRIDRGLGFPPAILFAVMLLVFVFPGYSVLHPLPDMLSALVILPAILYLGAASRPGRRLGQACRALGDLSYPLYAIHLPVVVYLGGFMLRARLAWPLDLALVLLATVGLVLVAHLDYRFYDAPVRQGLRRLLIRRGRRRIQVG
ncbi:MAG: acyltransferase [Caulobacteraceae bacterium]